MILEFLKFFNFGSVVLGVFLLWDYVKAEVGDPCENKNYGGICTEASKCIALEQNMIAMGLKNNDVASCGFATYEELICCPSSTTTTATTPTPTIFQPLTNLNQNLDNNLEHFDLNKLISGKSINNGNRNDDRLPEMPTNINPSNSNNPFTPFNFRPWTEQKPVGGSGQDIFSTNNNWIGDANRANTVNTVAQQEQQELMNRNAALGRPNLGNGVNSNTFTIQQQFPENQLKSLDRTPPVDLTQRRVSEIFDTNRSWNNAVAWPTNVASGRTSSANSDGNWQNNQQSQRNQHNDGEIRFSANNDAFGAINRQNNQQPLGNRGNDSGRMARVNNNAFGGINRQQQQMPANQNNGGGSIFWLNNDGFGASNAPNRAQLVTNRENGPNRFVNGNNFSSKQQSSSQNTQQNLAGMMDDGLVEKTIKDIFLTSGDWNMNTRRLPNNNW